MNKLKKIAIGVVATGILLANALPAFALPPGPPTPAKPGCPGRSSTDLIGPQAIQPDLTKMANGDCPVPAGFVPAQP